jgi:mycothiol synthase
VEIGPATEEEWPAALRLFFQREPSDDRELRVALVRELIARGELANDAILVCRERGIIVGVMIATLLTGFAVLCWPPQVVASADASAMEDCLINEALARARARGSCFAQALMTAEEIAAAPALWRGGFTHITALLYLERPTNQPLPPATASRLTWTEFGQCDRALFASVLGQTYEGSLDCPELNGLRTNEQVVQGYMAAAHGKTQGWWLAHWESRPAGVVVAMPQERGRVWELAYLGLVSAARGRGLGKEMLDFAVRDVAAGLYDSIALAVDARNHPGLKLYQRHGFTEAQRREVLLRPLLTQSR